MEKKRLALAVCGSYCTYEKLFEELERLKEKYEIFPVMSERACSTSSRFGRAQDNRERLTAICGREPLCSIEEAERLGPGEGVDIVLIFPCTGNTLGKLANGITDSAVLMAAKAHLRNSKPVLLAISTNDGLSGSAENIARLLNRKNIYFVPFRQDAPEKKPFSLQSDFSLVQESINAALDGRQLQPIIR